MSDILLDWAMVCLACACSWAIAYRLGFLKGRVMGMQAAWREALELIHQTQKAEDDKNA